MVPLLRKLDVPNVHLIKKEPELREGWLAKLSEL